ncbi:hypothetical protein TNCV_4524921 [Trichonephila clavipes]|nr:hypothetical protein TNCV_4524921 [Trichonephila clavipes]
MCMQETDSVAIEVSTRPNLNGIVPGERMRVILTSHYKPTRGLLITNLIIFERHLSRHSSLLTTTPHQREDIEP